MDISLESILDSRDNHYDDFTLYMHHTYCIENLYFWQDVQNYKLNPSLGVYQIMIEKYIVANAPHEINIPCDMRQQLLDTHTPHCFDEAAESILELIRVNSFLPWYQSQYQNSISTTSRNSLSPSLSLPERCNLLRHHPSLSFSISRPSFSSVRSSSAVSMFTFTDKLRNHSKAADDSSGSNKKLSSLFQRKRQALMIRMKKTFIEHDFNSNKNNGLSWLAKK